MQETFYGPKKNLQEGKFEICKKKNQETYNQKQNKTCDFQKQFL